VRCYTCTTCTTRDEHPLWHPSHVVPFRGCDTRLVSRVTPKTLRLSRACTRLSLALLATTLACVCWYGCNLCRCRPEHTLAVWHRDGLLSRELPGAGGGASGVHGRRWRAPTPQQQWVRPHMGPGDGVCVHPEPRHAASHGAHGDAGMLAMVLADSHCVCVWVMGLRSCTCRVRPTSPPPPTSLCHVPPVFRIGCCCPQSGSHTILHAAALPRSSSCSSSLPPLPRCVPSHPPPVCSPQVAALLFRSPPEFEEALALCELDPSVAESRIQQVRARFGYDLFAVVRSLMWVVLCVAMGGGLPASASHVYHMLCRPTPPPCLPPARWVSASSWAMPPWVFFCRCLRLVCPGRLICCCVVLLIGVSRAPYLLLCCSFDWCVQGEYKTALEHLYRSGEPVHRILSLYPQLLPRGISLARRYALCTQCCP
jgi:hypothetical protein